MIAPAHIVATRLGLISLFLSLCVSGMTAQISTGSTVQPIQIDPLARPRKTQKPTKAENAYKKWRDDDVKDIITADELSAFNKLTNDLERDNFIEAFWRRRDPTPDTEENEYKEEHYRRRAYADDHFSAGVPGSKTDRGRIYIIHGPPDSIDSHPAGGPYERPPEEGGGQTSVFPFEIWRYRNIDGIGQEVQIEFVDPCMCGEYHITLDPGEKDALAHVGNAGLTTREAMGLDSKANRFRNGLNTAGSSMFGNNQAREFDGLERNALVLAPPPVKFKDLRAVVDIKMRYNLLPFGVRVDFIKAPAGGDLVPVTLQVANRDLTYVAKDGMQHAAVNIYGRVTTLSGKIVKTFEEPLHMDIPADMLEKNADGVSLYQQILPMTPGRYRLDLVLKDVNGDKLGTLYQSIMVPDFSTQYNPQTSSLILADMIERVPAREIGAGQFVMGATRIRTRVPPPNGEAVIFKSGQNLNLWMQVYGFAADTTSGKRTAKVQYQVADAAGNRVYGSTESVESSQDDEITLQKTLSSTGLQRGTYQISVEVQDAASQKTVSSSAKFAIQ